MAARRGSMSSSGSRLRLSVRDLRRRVSSSTVPVTHCSPTSTLTKRTVQMLDIKPCLWFHAEAEEAATFYVSLFPNSKIATVMRGGPGSPAIAVDFVLDGHP